MKRRNNLNYDKTWPSPWEPNRASLKQSKESLLHFNQCARSQPKASENPKHSLLAKASLLSQLSVSIEAGLSNQCSTRVLLFTRIFISPLSPCSCFYSHSHARQDKISERLRWKARQYPPPRAYCITLAQSRGFQLSTSFSCDVTRALVWLAWM